MNNHDDAIKLLCLAVFGFFVGLIALLHHCEPKPQHLPDRYYGLPTEERSCSWNITNKRKGECISAGRRFRCNREDKTDGDNVWTDVACTPYRLFR